MITPGAPERGSTSLARRRRCIDLSSFMRNTAANLPAQKSFVDNIRSIIEVLQGNSGVITPDNFLEALREDFPPHKLFCAEILSKPDYFRKLKRLFEKIGVIPVPFEECPRKANSFQIAATVYPGDDHEPERNLAYRWIECFRNLDPTTPGSPVTSLSPARLPPTTPFRTPALDYYQFHPTAILDAPTPAASFRTTCTHAATVAVATTSAPCSTAAICAASQHTAIHVTATNDASATSRAKCGEPLNRGVTAQMRARRAGSRSYQGSYS